MVAKLPAAFALLPLSPPAFAQESFSLPSSFLPSIPPETEFLLQPCLSPPTTLRPLATRSTGCPSRNRVNATLQDPNLPPPPLPDLLLLRLLLLRMCRACACCLRARGHGPVRVRRPRVRRWRTKKRGRPRRRQRPSSFLLSSLARSLTVVARSPPPSLYPSISSERSWWSKGRRMSTKPYLQ